MVLKKTALLRMLTDGVKSAFHKNWAFTSYLERKLTTSFPISRHHGIESTLEKGQYMVRNVEKGDV